MHKRTEYLIRALGVLWTGHETWGEERKDYRPRADLIRHVFPDFASVTDYEIRKVETITSERWLQRWNKSVLRTKKPGGVRRTTTDTREIILRPWRFEDSAEQYDALDAGEDWQPLPSDDHHQREEP